jgi:indole-3-glycerol phosphate synthase
MSATGLETGFLAEMARASRARATRLAARVGGAELERRAAALPPPPLLCLADAGFDLLAEIKFASPAAGALASAADAQSAAEQARHYANAGAAAISVLTEPTRFAGARSHLSAVARAVSLPVLRKDFLVEPLQVHEARIAGAGGVLLILRMLDESTLAAMLAAARAARLFVLLEAFDAADLERAARILESGGLPPVLVGVNARDLETLAVVPGRHLALAPHLPAGVPCVAESGITSPSDARAAAAAGYRLALVGSALMRAADPRAAARALLDAGRAGAAENAGGGR